MKKGKTKTDELPPFKKSKLPPVLPHNNPSLTQQQSIVSPQAYEKFASFLNKRKTVFLKQKFEEYYGKNFPINYRECYNFDEQWQNRTLPHQKDNLFLSNQQSNTEVVLSALTMLVFALTIWTASVSFFFANGLSFYLDVQLYVFGLLVSIINTGLKLKKYYARKEHLQDKASLLAVFFKKILIIAYFIAKMVGCGIQHHVLWTIYEIVLWAILYLEASKRYYSLRLLSLSLHYENHSKLVDLMLTIFIIAHFITIVLYSATKINPTNNWLLPLDLDPQKPMVIYIYSFYFCVTTIMTVGYGDITPKNYAEVMIVSLVQIFGIIMFGYMINQIGYCISSLRRDKEVMEKDLFVVEKLKRHYKMDQNLVNKVRQYLVYSKPKLDQVSPEEEKGILIKLNQEIREDLVKKNLASVVRSSIFFLCRWSKNFQSSISNRLIHIMLNPNEILYQPKGRQRIYIIKSGKIHIYVERIGNKRGMNRPLKQIETKIEDEVSDNCYGYSSVISERQSRVYGTSKDFTSCYYIQKPSFKQCVHEKMEDKEYYHEIKDKIGQNRISESLEVPLLESSKHHYRPSKANVIKKNKANNCRNQRTPNVKRRDEVLRGKDHIFDQQISKRLTKINEGSFESLNSLVDNPGKQQTNKPDKLNEQTAQQMMRLMVDSQLTNNFQHFFQESKEYSNYFVNHNQQQVLKKYDNSLYLPPNFKLRSQFSKKMYKAAVWIANNRNKK